MHAFVRSNMLRLAVLLWFAGWLVLVMPGHKRGIVTLPSAEAHTEQADQSCCTPPPPSCCDTSVVDGDCPKPTDPAKHCAICFLKSHLTDPPPLAFYTPYLGELDELAYLIESSTVHSLAVPQRTRGRAPPA